jgi:hypothetical protein
MSGRELSKSLSAAAQCGVDSTHPPDGRLAIIRYLSNVDGYVIAASVIGHQNTPKKRQDPGSRASFTVNPRGILRSACKVAFSVSSSRVAPPVEQVVVVPVTWIGVIVPGPDSHADHNRPNRLECRKVLNLA